MPESITIEKMTDGTDLAYSTTQNIIQDSRGFIWFGTNKGLVKHNGVSFDKVELFRNIVDAPEDVEIKSMCQNKYGNIITCTASGTLLEYNLESERSHKIELPFQSFLRGNESLKIIEDDYENLWVGTIKFGLFNFNRISGEYAHFKKDLSNPGRSVNCNTISSFYFDNKYKKLYIGTFSGGLNIYDYENNRFIYTILGKTNPTLQSHGCVNFIYRDRNCDLWTGTPGQIYLIDNDNKKVEKFKFDHESVDPVKGNYVYSMCEDEKGLLWMGSGDGLICFDFKKRDYERFNLNDHSKNGKFNNLVKCLYKDRSEVIWIGTENDGIAKFDKIQKRFFRIETEFKNPDEITKNSYSVFKDGDEIFVGTVRDGLYKYNEVKGNKFELTKFKELEHTTVTGITRDNSNNLWVGCNKFGLIYIKGSEDKINLIEPKLLMGISDFPALFSACQCRDRTNPAYLWLSINYIKLIILDTKNKTLIENKKISEGLDNIAVCCLYMDSNNDMWIGTDGFGLYHYSKSKNALTNYKTESNEADSISNSHIKVITEDAENNIWIGTKKGLNKFDHVNNKFKRINIPVTYVSGLIFDENNYLWISEGNKLIRMNIESNEMIIFSDLNEFNDSSYFKSNDETIYFGGKNGVTYFKPNEIKTNPHIAHIALTDFQIFYESVKPSPDNPFLKKSISYAEGITLTYKESVITFEFAALIYNNPKMNQYAYKMEGFDEDWVYCGTRRTATYTNLDPGEYRFRVKGSNNDGLWNEEGTSIKVIITPPWYKTVLFKGLVGLSLIGSIGSFYRKRIQKLNKEKKQQEEFTKKLIESQENERKRVAAELHDSLGQDLLIIKNKLLTNIKKSEDERYIEQFRELSELTTSTLDDVREISYNLRPYELDRLRLTKTIKSMIERANNSTSINFAANIDDIDKVFIPEVEINFYRIIQESLNNVIKHSEASEVNLIIKRSEKEIDINMSDNGKGFDIRKYSMKPEKNGFGLKGIEERVRLMNGEFNIESEIGKGTIIRIIIPFSK